MTATMLLMTKIIERNGNYELHVSLGKREKKFALFNHTNILKEYIVARGSKENIYKADNIIKANSEFILFILSNNYIFDDYIIIDDDGNFYEKAYFEEGTNDEKIRLTMISYGKNSTSRNTFILNGESQFKYSLYEDTDYVFIDDEDQVVLDDYNPSSCKIKIQQEFNDIHEIINTKVDIKEKISILYRFGCRKKEKYIKFSNKIYNAASDQKVGIRYNDRCVIQPFNEYVLSKYKNKDLIISKSSYCNHFINGYSYIHDLNVNIIHNNISIFLDKNDKIIYDYKNERLYINENNYISLTNITSGHFIIETRILCDDYKDDTLIIEIK